MENRIFPAAITALAIVISAFIISNVLSDFNKSKQTINVTGSARRNIVADFGKLGFSISVNAVSPLEGVREINRQKPLLLEFLKNKGITDEKIKWRPVNSFPVYQINESGYQTEKIISYNVSQEMSIESDDVQLIEYISLEVASLLEKGLNLSIHQPEYYYTKLASLKIEIQAEAAADALNRAAKIAEATGRKIGPLISARMGVLQITPEHSNMVSDYGVNDVSSIKKEITAVVNATFLVK